MPVVIVQLPAGALDGLPMKAPAFVRDQVHA